MNPILLDIPEQIETQRLFIRCPRPGDGLAVHQGVIETLVDLRTWPASMPWVLFQPSIEASEVFCRQSYAEYISRKELPMLLFLKKDNEYVGASGLHNLDWSVPKFEIGYWCRKRYQGQGLITEAVTAITEFAFTNLKARRVASLADEQNTASRRVLERSGYVLEGIMRNERVAPGGNTRDTCLYAITRDLK
jgi:RimJ/RimL family protein N-acetyltransferase